MLAQGLSNRWFHGGINGAGTTEVAYSLLGHPALQVACPGFTMLRMALGRQAKSFLRPFVRLLLWHRFSASTSGGS